MFHRIHLHFTYIRTGFAFHTFFPVHPIPEHRDRIEYRIHRPQRADIFTKRPVDQDRQNDRNQKQHIFPDIQPPNGAPHRLIQQNQRYPALQRPCRTDQLTEPWHPLSQKIHQEHRQQYDKYRQDQVFQFSQHPVSPEGSYLFKKRDLIKQVLNQPERTEPAADKSPDQRTHKHQKTGHIKRQFKIPASDHSLHGPDRTGPESPGAGITIQAGNTQAFQLPLIDPSLYKSQQITVGKQRPQRLYPMSSLIQFQYTPDRY